ncbi:lysozyme inhibitor LprI family protein [Pseudomonas sp. NPDC088885]|uniref:lysozyme inhibitor LprI family protein n=1 Tax=Pseudomonas sp. NPDC088885 TaxID=3364457 RepID=UPI0038228233
MRNFLLLIGLLVPLSVAAAQSDCVSISTSQQVDICAKQAKESADSNLNSSYQKLIKRVASQYQVDAALRGDYMQKLKESQRAWLKLRDTNCTLEAFEVEVGQPAYLTTVNNCVARMSLERSIYLDKTLPDL